MGETGHREDLPVAIIGRPRGLEGALFVRLFNPASLCIQAGANLLVHGNGPNGSTREANGPGPGGEMAGTSQDRGDRRRVCILNARSVGKPGQMEIRIQGIRSREDAKDLTGALLLLPAADLDPAGPDSFYHAEVLGWQVRTEDGEILGVVHDVFTAAGDILVVRGKAGEWMFPCVQDVIMSLDTTHRRFVIRIPPGLEPQPYKAAGGVADSQIKPPCGEIPGS